MGLLLCAAISAVGVVLFARAGRVPVTATGPVRGSAATDAPFVAAR